jgi:hypothetical protein
VRTSLAAHAPYSVAPLVLRAIRRASDRDPFARCSVHLSEAVEEVEFIKTGRTPAQEDGVGMPPGGLWRRPVQPTRRISTAGSSFTACR